MQFQRPSYKSVAYAFFALFCALSAFRDVFSEGYFKDKGASAVFVLFIYSVVTQVFSLMLILVRRAAAGIGENRPSEFSMEMFWINIFTLTAFLFYFWAIESPLGAALNAFVDYGVGPAATGAVAAFVAKERLSRLFFVSVSASLLGIAIFTVPRWQAQEISIMWFVGLSLALLSALSGAMFWGYMKSLLNRGVDKAEIVFWRLTGLSLSLGAILTVRPDLFSRELLIDTAVVGFIGFTVPLFISLYVLQRVTLRSFSLLLFLYPVLTYAMSAYVSLVKVYESDIIASALMFGAIGIYERYSDRNSGPGG